MSVSNAAIDHSSAGDGLTLQVAQFIEAASATSLPDIVVANGKKSILDGLGLALSGSVASPGCSNTLSTLTPLPVISQIALPKLRASFSQTSYSGVPTVGICPQHLKSLRLITPLAPSDIT